MIDKTELNELQNEIVKKMEMCLTGVTRLSSTTSDESVARTVLFLAKALDVLDYVETKEGEEE